MRDLSSLLRVPSREELRARIVAPERFRPEPRLRRPVKITMLEDGFAEIDIRLDGAPHRIHPMLIEAHKALDEGAPFDAIVERAFPLCPKPHYKLCEKLLRSYLLKLHEVGVVDLAFEPPPAMFAQRYERVKTLGRGGMGIVHLCKDRQRAGEPVVIKHAWGWSKPVEKAEQVNRREAAVLAQLDHPLVPKLLDVFEDRGILHIVRGYADGQPLLRMVEPVRALDLAERLRLARDLCDVVHHIHERGFLYLDVKPDNFILSDVRGRPMLLDMGLCRESEEPEVKLRQPIGSRGYVAPEVLHQRVASVRSDIYGIGRTWFFLATATKPRQKFGVEDLASILRKGRVDAREAELILRLCAERPDERPADLAEAIEQIDALLQETEPA